MEGCDNCVENLLLFCKYVSCFNILSSAYYSIFIELRWDRTQKPKGQFIIF